MKHTMANSVDTNGAKRTVAFYRSTRPQAPARHKRDSNLAHLVECSVCRGLFFEDTKVVKAAHRKWHEANKVGALYHPMTCEQPQIDQALDGRYQFLTVCTDCGEDLCPCVHCEKQHTTECTQWMKVWALLDEGDGEAADALANEILAGR